MYKPGGETTPTGVGVRLQARQHRQYKAARERGRLILEGIDVVFYFID
jgi:hypothetical protein